MTLPAVLPVAIVLPHSGLLLPPEVKGRVALNEQQIFNEADAYTDLLYDFRSRVAAWISFPYARALLDVNRADDPARNRSGDGIVKTRTSYGAEVYRAGLAPDHGLERALIERYWRPWHQELAALSTNHEIRLVLDCHSMAAAGPSQYDDPSAVRPRAAVCNLGNAQGEPQPQRGRVSAAPALARRFGDLLAPLLADLPALTATGPAVLLNQPFVGGWDIQAHARAGQPWLMLELSRALYIGAQTGDSQVVPPDLDRIASLRDRLWQAITTLSLALDAL